MNILQLASERIGLTSEKVFGDSYAYWEVRVPKKYICDKFLDYAYEDKIPECVCDYCLDILAGRVTKMKLLTDRKRNDNS
jgi:hypothetical protein